ncbi:11689_t:CDS:2 [Entrophospora sp. SA101]|nr:11689_t:CDS:2 [Entrophospora sp. SA101]
MSISSILNNVSSDRNDNESSNGKLGNDDICSSASIIDNSLTNSFNIDELVFSDDDPEYLMEIDTLIKRKDGKIPFLDMTFNFNCDHIDQLNSNIKYTTDDIFYGSDLTEIYKKRKLDKPAPSSSSPITKQKRKYDKNPPDSNVTIVTTAATATTIPFPTTSNIPNTTATFTSSQSDGKKNIFKCRVPGCEKVFSSSSNLP